MDLYALDWLLVFLGYGIAALTAFLLSKKYDVVNQSERRIGAIDGLRGVAAFGVFLNHGYNWWTFARKGEWWAPGPQIFAHLGMSGVLAFFMITAFLFTTRVRQLDLSTGQAWMRLMWRRWLRIAPLYYFSIALVFLIVLSITGLHMMVYVDELAYQVGSWLLFTGLGELDINGVANTKLINGGVSWTLAYEELFYWSLPCLYLVVRRKLPPMSWLIAGCVALTVLLAYFRHDYICAFPVGWLATYIIEWPRVKAFFAQKWLGFVFLLAALNVLTFTPNSRDILALPMIGLIFIAILCGNPAFNILKTRASRLLGEVSYSFYCLHGILLFLVLQSLTMPTVAALPLPVYIVLIGAMIPLSIYLSVLSFKYIERPFLR